MKIYNIEHNINFQRQLKADEEHEYKIVLKQAKEKVGNKGFSTLIIPSNSLPDTLNRSTGCGNMLSKESQDFFDFAKLYWGINYVQLLPEGDFSGRKNKVRPYSGSALDLGKQVINLETLTEYEYANLLSKNDLKDVFNANKLENKDIKVNYNNVIQNHSSADKALRKAFDEFLKNDTRQKNKLHDDFENYCTKNADWLERKAVYKALVLKNEGKDHYHWADNVEQNLFNPDLVTNEERKIFIDSLIAKPEYKKEGDFYKFTQFLADSNLQKAKDKLNQKGIKLSGDMLVNGGANDEVWMYPNAFRKNESLPWGLNAINFDTPEGIEYFKLKVRNFANRYDGVRVDASWLYAHQKTTGKCYEYGGKILDIIDEEFKKVKGNDYDLQNITHEFENGNDYSIANGWVLKEETRDRVKIYKSNHLSDNWGSSSAFHKLGWKDGTYMLGATNHDSVSIKTLFQNKKDKNMQIKTLSELLKIPEEKLQSISGFMQAKFAEPIRSFHNMFFFLDVLNLDGNYKECLKNESDEYCTKIPSNYKEMYFKSLEKGEGLNIMDALEKAFVAEGLNETEPDLYKKIVKYRDILNGNEGVGQKRTFGKKPIFIIVSAIITLSILTGVLLFKKKHSNKTKQVG